MLDALNLTRQRYRVDADPRVLARRALSVAEGCVLYLGQLYLAAYVFKRVVQGLVGVSLVAQLLLLRDPLLEPPRQPAVFLRLCLAS